MRGSRYSSLALFCHITDKGKSNMYKPNDLVVNGKRTENFFNTPDRVFAAENSAPIRGFWTNTRVLQVEPLVDETLSLFIQQATQRFADGSICMMEQWLDYLSWDAATNTAFGKHYGFLEQGKDVKDTIGISEQGIRYFALVSQIPWLDEWLDKNPVYRIGPRPIVHGYLAGAQIYQDYLQDIESGRAVEGSQQHFMDKYHTLKEKNEIATDEQIMKWLMFNLVAGGDSTSGVMKNAAYYVAKDASIYEKLRKELDDANITSSPVPYKDIKDLPYLSAVMQESLRYNAPLGLMLERIVP